MNRWFTWLMMALAFLAQGCADMVYRSTPAPVSDAGRQPRMSPPVVRTIPPRTGEVQVYPYRASGMAEQTDGGTFRRNPPPAVAGQPYPYGIPATPSQEELTGQPASSYVPPPGGAAPPPLITGQPYPNGIAPGAPASDGSMASRNDLEPELESPPAAPLVPSPSGPPPATEDNRPAVGAPITPPPSPVAPAAPPKKDTSQDYAYRVPPTSFQPSRPVQQLVQQAESQRGSGDLAAAAATLERALRIEPRNPHLWNRLARVRLQTGEYRQADSLAAKSNALAGDVPNLKQDNWRIIASARRGAGDTAGAETAERRATGK